MRKLPSSRTARFESLEKRQMMAADSLIALGADAGPTSWPNVILTTYNGFGPDFEFSAYNKAFRGGVRVALADLNKDGVDEVITAPGPGMSAVIKVFTIEGTELPQYRFTAYPKSFQGGAYVAAADVNGDGYKDLVTTPGKGRAAEVRVWRNRGSAVGSIIVSGGITHRGFFSEPYRKFLAFGKNFKGGATVSGADLNGDGKAEVVVGNEPGMSPHVRVFDLTKFKQTSELKLARHAREILPFGEDYRGGVFVAAGNESQIVIGNGLDGNGEIEVYNYPGTLVLSLNAYEHHNPNFQAPVRVAVRDVHGEEKDEILTSPGVEWGASLLVWQFERADVPVRLSGIVYGGLKHGFFIT